MIKKIILATLFLIGIAYAINVFLVRKYKKENEELLQYSIKQERLNIQLTREAFENYPYRKDFGARYELFFDTLSFYVDSIINDFPNFKAFHKGKINYFASIIATRRVNLDSIFKMYPYKSKFELELLTWLNLCGKECFIAPICFSIRTIMFISESNTPLGKPLPFYCGFIGKGCLDISKNLKINIPFHSDSLDKRIGYLPADKIGKYEVYGYYNYSYLGIKEKFPLMSLEYTVTEPDIRTTIVDKNYLNLNQDNRVSFNFGRYKLKDVIIKIEGANFKPIDDNTYSIYPTNKKVKIKYSLNTHYNNKIMDLGYKEYEAR